MNRVLGRYLDAMIALSESHRDYIVANEGIDRHKVHVIHNGIDLERFSGPTHQRRSDLGIADDVKAIGVVAALRPEKAHDTFLQAAALVAGSVKNAHFLLVGDGPERDQLVQLTKKLRLTDRVHFLGRRDDVANILPLLDLTVLPSRAEAFPLAILESMAAGVPVVATDVGSVHDIVTEGETGILVQPENVEELARAMTTLLTQAELAHRMAEVARERVQRYDVRRMVRNVEDLFEDLVQAKT
jgi:glycosyltransferase involved in cell wall biosynthesis